MVKEVEETPVEEAGVVDPVGLDDQDAEDDELVDLVEEIFPDAEEASTEETQAVDTQEADKTVVGEPEEQSPAQPEESTTEEAAKPAEEVASEEAAKPAEKEPVTEPLEPVETPEELQARLIKFNDDAVDLLSKQVYNLSEEQVMEFETDPAEALPKFAAKLHMEVMRATTQNLARLMPQMVETINAQTAQSSQLTDQFYSAHEHLRGHEAEIMRFGGVYRQMNPTASAAEFIRDVGAQVSFALKLAPTQVEEPVKAAPVTPPFKPAAGSVGGGASVRSAPQNIFESLAEDILAEDVD